MEWDPAAQERPPPRHELESDDEGEPVAEPVRVSFNGTVESGKPFVVLIGQVGAAVLAQAAYAHKSTWPEHATLSVNALVTGHVHVGDQGQVIIFVPRPELLQLYELAPVARAIVGARPSCVTILHSYSPGLYLGSSAPEPPLRFLDSERKHHEWPFAPLEVPNVVTGLEAAIFSACAYSRIPAFLVGIPSSHPVPHQSFHWRESERTRVVPAQQKDISPADALAHLAHVGDQLSDDHVEALVALVGSGNGVDAPRSLLVAAHHALCLTRSASEVGIVGDGGMYV